MSFKDALRSDGDAARLGLMAQIEEIFSLRHTIRNSQAFVVELTTTRDTLHTDVVERAFGTPASELVLRLLLPGQVSRITTLLLGEATALSLFSGTS